VLLAEPAVMDHTSVKMSPPALLAVNVCPDPPAV
jgi:hypothetical protein